ncbi:hypothetical protein SPRG_01055 [Saprolegnia parasitica CBS 223.65]|uniref:Uncharacterized protein n=1 Tax=Saprolegnia parasitica (strain CBS 223.65) TaxID=695850 RepID=A0A067D7K5_SAPPC|nr:hypothetical protein SPRG_01055 [Saprolegnia parasitica CBS 223.65]KDO34992.1 hypothetical protein SPRG_01055 [Saprolegnia parasitica CBS 223.65]|eukprot:XP_012194645.1 hypothetical protein SPRG_01055 [Saprolegnia parasitica CBS 223.65]
MDGKPPEMTASASFDVDMNETNIFLRKELQAIGAVDADDDAAILVRDDDEVSVELRKCEQELARQVVVTNRLKSALYHAIQARSTAIITRVASHTLTVYRAEANTSADDHATLKLYHKLQRKRQDAKRKRKQSSKKQQHKQQKRQV